VAVIVEREGTALRVNLGRPIVNNRTLLRSCANVHEPIKLLLGMVSGQGLGIIGNASTTGESQRRSVNVRQVSERL